MPYAGSPGPAASRSATSACTSTRPLRRDGSRSTRVSTTGTAMLYGRFATSAVGAAGAATSAVGAAGAAVDAVRATNRAGSTRSASAVTTVRRATAAGARSATVPGRAAASTGSISTATTRAPVSSRASVSEPSPGPTSRTTSCGPTSASRAMRRTVLASCMKFWPSTFVGRTPNRSASRRTSAGPSRATSSGIAPAWQNPGLGGGRHPPLTPPVRAAAPAPRRATRTEVPAPGRAGGVRPGDAHAA